MNTIIRKIPYLLLISVIILSWCSGSGINNFDDIEPLILAYSNRPTTALPLKVLSYNVSWEAMTNSHMGSGGDLGKICGRDLTIDFRPTICAKNMARTIDQTRENYGPDEEFDFVALQESADWDHLQKLSKALQSLVPLSLKYGKYVMATFYNGRKYHLKQEIQGGFDPRDRPFHILIFDEKIIFVNLHNGNDDDKYNKEYVERHLSTSLKENFIGNVNLDLKDFRIIMAGDFNDHRRKIFEASKIDGFIPFRFAGLSTRVIWRDSKVLNTCCSTKVPFNQSDAWCPGDYILDSHNFLYDKNYILGIPRDYNSNIPQSDHLPVIYKTWI